MINDVDLIAIKTMINQARLIAWVTVGLIALITFVYLIATAIVGYSLLSRVADIVGLLLMLGAAIALVFLVKSAQAAFPLEGKLRMKTLLFAIAPSTIAMIASGAVAISIQLFTRETPIMGVDFIGIMALIVSLPVSVILFHSGQQMGAMETKYGVEGTKQLHEYQLAIQTKKVRP